MLQAWGSAYYIDFWEFLRQLAERHSNSCVAIILIVVAHRSVCTEFEYLKYVQWSSGGSEAKVSRQSHAL